MGRKLNESLGVSDVVLNTAKKITDKIQYYIEKGGSEDYTKTERFTRACFMIEKVGFIGKLWVQAVLIYDDFLIENDRFIAEVPFYELDELTIKDDYLYNADKYMDYLQLNVRFKSFDTLLTTITHELKHLYYSYISKLKNIKQDEFYEDGVRNINNRVGNFLHNSSIDEIQAYTHDSYIEVLNGKDIKDTNLYDIYDYLKSVDITDYFAELFVSISNFKGKNPKKYLERRKQVALNTIRKNLNKIMAKVNEQSIQENKQLNESYQKYDVSRVDCVEYDKTIYEADPEDEDDEDYITYDVTAFDSDTNELFHVYDIDSDELIDIFGENIATEIIESSKESGYLQDLLSTSVSDINDVNEVNAVAKRYFSTPYYEGNDRGYILTDGTFIWFGDGQDHAHISAIDGMTVGRFVGLGNIRIGHSFFEVAKEPTSQQRQALRHLIANNQDDSVYVDIITYDFNSNDTYGQTITSASYETHNPRMVLNQIDRFFYEGTKLSGSNSYENDYFYESKQIKESIDKKRIIITEEQLKFLIENLKKTSHDGWN